MSRCRFDRWICANHLHSSLLVLLVVCIVQFLVVFHLLQTRNDVVTEFQIVDLLKAVQEQNLILRRQNVPLRRPRVSPLVQVFKIPVDTKDRCNPVHIAIVCAGYSSARTVVTLIKSILFYRSTPIHLHLIVDPVAGHILEHLFQTWNVPSLTYIFYSTETLLKSIDWIRNTHYSGKYGLMKLVITEALSRNVSKVIVLDTDVTFNADISELWAEFRNFNASQAVGIVENQSSWYLSTSHWPALGPGFNSGVMLLHLTKLRSIGWAAVWTRVAATQLQIHSQTQLADQDIFNAVFKEVPRLVSTLPCTWNVQLNDRAWVNSRQCYLEGGQVPKVIHWNAFHKDQLQDRHGGFFRKMYQTFAEYDGNLLRKEVLGCRGDRNTSYQVQWRARRPVTDECADMKRAGAIAYRTHLFFLPFNASDHLPGVDVTFVTQLSVDRMLMLETLALQWSGPISAAVFGTDPEAETLVDFVATSNVLHRRKNIAYHVVYKDGGNLQAFYPVNYLRNVALGQVDTPFVLLADVDFVPKVKLRDYLIDTIRNMSLTEDSRVALVVPPFETSMNRFFLPIYKKLLLTLWDRKLVSPFRFGMWKPGQYPVNYTNWRTAVEPYEVEWTPYFEPYVVVPRSAPKFDTRFVGFGWNKVAHSMALHAQRYKFIVLPEAFIVHLPHSTSMSNNRFRLDYRYRRCMNRLKQEFLNELQSNFSES